MFAEESDRRKVLRKREKVWYGEKRHKILGNLIVEMSRNRELERVRGKIFQN